MIDNLGLGMTNSGLISIILPNPLQFGQAPTGELNEKAEGVGFANLLPFIGDRNPSYNKYTCFPFWFRTSHIP